MRFSKPLLRKTPALGDLEVQILERLWAASEPVDARSVLAALAGRRISLSTVQATLERLHRKGLLARQKVSRAFVYSASVSRERLIGTLINDLAQRLAAGELEPVISGFVDLVGEADPELLRRLESTAKARRRE